jgi:tetratricopeptide (TPR) repeat protein
MAELLQHYRQLPARKSNEDAAAWTRRLGDELGTFAQKVSGSYLEGTLQRLLNSSLADTRQAAVLALGLLGTMESNRTLARMLRDRDTAVRQMAADAMWSLWFRADTPENGQELRRLSALLREPELDAEAVRAGLDALIEKAPEFAEAYNQRAVLSFRLGAWLESVADCERALRLNRQHFGAASGMAQCYLKLRRTKLALRAYRRALHLNPNLTGVQQVIRSLERLLDEEGKRRPGGGA